MRIFVDAMGGDLAPQAPVEGTVEALRRNPELTVTLAGIVPEIEKYLAGADDVRSRITLLDAPEVITNHESPVMGVRKRRNQQRCWECWLSATRKRTGSSPPGLRAQCWRAACSGWGVFRAWSVRRLPR